FIFYLIETKAFNGNLIISEQGEFTVEYGDRRYGIESPLEQSKRHESVLLRVMERLGITGRTHSKPIIKHVVLLHPKGVITRPDGRRFDKWGLSPVFPFSAELGE
uniref:nuclease-related domain-containing protein n=1 Tax=Acidithiobacillus sp. TaxID=1872118 RepID=UPI00262ECAC9